MEAERGINEPIVISVVLLMSPGRAVSEGHPPHAGNGEALLIDFELRRIMD